MKALIASSVLCLLAAVGYSLMGSAENPDAAAREPRGSATPRAHGELEPLELPEPEVAENEPAGDTEPELIEAGRDEQDDEPFDAIIRGRVVAAGPLSGNVRVILQAEVECSPDDDVCDRPHRAVDADAETGEFEIQVPPRHVPPTVAADAYLPSGETGLKVSAKETLEGVMLTLEPGSHITGDVYSEHEPVQSVRVVAIGKGYTRSVFTDDFGHFDIPALPQGEFRVRAYAPDHGGDEKRVLSGSTVSLDLAQRGRVRGRVVDARGFPVEGAVVSSDYTMTNSGPDSDVFPSDFEEYFEGDMSAHGCAPAPDCYVRAVTDAAGQFELATAPGEELTIAATHGGDRAEVSQVAYDSEPIELELATPSRIHLVDADGKSRGGTVHLWSKRRPGALFDEHAAAGDDGWLAIPAGARAGMTLQLPFPLRVDGDLPEGVQAEQQPNPDAANPWRLTKMPREEDNAILF